MQFATANKPQRDSPANCTRQTHLLLHSSHRYPCPELPDHTPRQTLSGIYLYIIGLSGYNSDTSGCNKRNFSFNGYTIRRYHIQYIGSIRFHTNFDISGKQFETPHLHATVIPIVMGEHRKAKNEEGNGKRKYRKKGRDTVRLCADDVLTREKLIAYHDSYAQAMTKYGLQRGIRGSEARHTTTAEDELQQVKNEIRVDKLKGAAATAATNIAESVGSLLGSNKFKRLESENCHLRQDVTTHEETIEALQAQI